MAKQYYICWLLTKMDYLHRPIFSHAYTCYVVVLLCICILVVLRPFLVFRFDKMGSWEL